MKTIVMLAVAAAGLVAGLGLDLYVWGWVLHQLVAALALPIKE